jgi:cell division septation protein DedD
MARTEDGEYELVLGNRQLLSIFFVVVLLLGAGFTLGYILGRNSAASVPAVEVTEKKTAETPILVDPPKDTRPSAAVESTVRPVDTPVANPAADENKATPAEPKSEATPPPSTAAEKKGASGDFKSGVPPEGSVFVQVAAVRESDAQTEAALLRKKGFPVWVAPSDKPELFTVLVGPYTDVAELSKAKASLEQLGFKRVFRKEFRKKKS